MPMKENNYFETMLCTCEISNNNNTWSINAPTINFEYLADLIWDLKKIAILAIWDRIGLIFSRKFAQNG